MKRIYKILSIIASLVVIDCLVGVIGSTILRNLPESNNNDNTVNQALLTKKVEFLVLGSSKAYQNIDNNKMQKEYGLSCYNAGASGMDILFSYCVFKEMTQRCKVRDVILTVDPQFLDGSQNNMMSSKKIYYKLDTDIKRFIDDENDFVERMKFVSNLYVYNGLLGIIVRDQSSKSATSNNGFAPSDVHNKDIKLKKDKNHYNFKFGEKNLECLNYIADYCKKHQIRLFLVYTPDAVEYFNNDFFSEMKEYCHKRDIIFLDYNHDSRFKNPQYYYDNRHLNKDGAELFSTILINEIKDKVKH